MSTKFEHNKVGAREPQVVEHGQDVRASVARAHPQGHIAGRDVDAVFGFVGVYLAAVFACVASGRIH